MKKINWNILFFTCFLCLIPILFGMYFFEELPDIMAIHFNINNEADNWASKKFVIFVLPMIMAALQVFTCITSDIVENKKGKSPKLAKIMKWFIPIITFVVYTITILIGLGKTINVGKIVCIFLGLMFMIMGNYMPKMTYEEAKGNINPLPPNERDFKTMMRLWGYTLVLGGLFTIIGIFFSNMTAFIILMGMCVLVFIESLYFSYKKN